eukprot:3399567-Alexandrium_andersonii.AAC.1
MPGTGTGEGLARRAHEHEVVLPGGDPLAELRPHVARRQIARARANPGVDDIHVVDIPADKAQDRRQAILPESRAGEE